MKIIPLTQGYFTYVSDEDYAELSKYKWYACVDKYGVRAKGWVNRKGILMHRLILGLTDPKVYCDHKDRNPLNNQRTNLRRATHGQNGINRAITGWSRFRGVTYDNGRIRAAFNADGKHMVLGSFITEEAAALRYNQVIPAYHGEFAMLNELTPDEMIMAEKELQLWNNNECICGYVGKSKKSLGAHTITCEKIKLIRTETPSKSKRQRK